MTAIYSVVIPAYNEEAFLPATLARLRQVMQETAEAGELIVVDNNSSDATAEIAKSHGARVIFEAVNQISRARNAGAGVASGEYLVFVDADTLLDTRLLRTALDAMASGEVCGGGAEVEPDMVLPWLPRNVLAFWNLVSRNMGLAAGCFVFCRRIAFEAVGGFSEKVYASEEIWLSRALRAWGRQQGQGFLIIRDPRIITSMRKLAWHSQAQLVLLTLPILFFPPLMRFRRFCSHWYRR